METALLSYGGCHGLVGGFYGEMSPNFDRLIKTAAAKGAELHAGKYGLTDGDMVRSVLANKIRTNWAMALARENAHVKLANIRWVRGAGFEEAHTNSPFNNSKFHIKFWGFGPGFLFALFYLCRSGTRGLPCRPRVFDWPRARLLVMYTAQSTAPIPRPARGPV